MKPVALTPRRIEQLKPESKPYIAWDAKVGGLGVRVMPGGTKSFVLRYRFNGQDRKPSLGKVDRTPLEKARDRARDILFAARKGEDLLAKPEPAPKALTVNEALDQWFGDYYPKLIAKGRKKSRTLYDYKRQARRVVRPAIGEMPIADVTRADVRRALKMVGGDIQRNRVRAMISSFMSWCEADDQEFREPGSNPVRGIKKTEERPRDRVLTANEKDALAEVLENMADDPAARALRFMMLTGFRVGEVRALQWGWVDLENRIIVLPDSKTGRSIRRLSTEACDFLRTVEPVDGHVRVFAGTYRGTPIGEKRLGTVFRQACEAARIADVQQRDLRRTFAVGLAEASLSALAIKDALGHASLQMIDRVYIPRGRNEHLSDELDRAASYHAEKRAGKVVRLAERRA